MVATSGMPVSDARRLHQRHDSAVRFQAVVLQFQEEILLAEEVRVFVGDAAGVVVAVLQEAFR